jgi:hypothetical protein
VLERLSVMRPNMWRWHRQSSAQHSVRCLAA